MMAGFVSATNPQDATGRGVPCAAARVPALEPATSPLSKSRPISPDERPATSASTSSVCSPSSGAADRRLARQRAEGEGRSRDGEAAEAGLVEVGEHRVRRPEIGVLAHGAGEAAEFGPGEARLVEGGRDVVEPARGEEGREHRRDRGAVAEAGALVGEALAEALLQRRNRLARAGGLDEPLPLAGRQPDDHHAPPVGAEEVLPVAAVERVAALRPVDAVHHDLADDAEVAEHRGGSILQREHDLLARAGDAGGGARRRGAP